MRKIAPGTVKPTCTGTGVLCPGAFAGQQTPVSPIFSDFSKHPLSSSPGLPSAQQVPETQSPKFPSARKRGSFNEFWALGTRARHASPIQHQTIAIEAGRGRTLEKKVSVQTGGKRHALRNILDRDCSSGRNGRRADRSLDECLDEGAQWPPKAPPRRSPKTRRMTRAGLPMPREPWPTPLARIESQMHEIESPAAAFARGYGVASGTLSKDTLALSQARGVRTHAGVGAN